MSIFFWLIIIIASYGAVFCRDGYHKDYISYKNIQPIKGIFILLVFLSHFVQYSQLNGIWDAPYFEIRRFLGQLVVVPFLFYSGYGISESIRKKGLPYVRNMPKHRILKVLLQFDIAVVLFFILRYVLGVSYDLRRIVLAFVGWIGIGNSNWYIFAIVFLYSFSYISALLFPKKELYALLCTTLLTGLFIVIMRQYKEEFWYNTTFAYVFGMWFSYFRPSFQQIILEKKQNYLLTLLLAFIAFLFFHAHWGRLIPYLVTGVLFALLIVLLSAKVQIRNKFLSYCGDHLFSLFILQRLPMIALDSTAIEHYPYLYLIVCLAITFLLSAAFDKVTAKLFP